MPELTIQFLDVGQGDGIFLQFAGGTTMLVDFGSAKGSTITRPDIFEYFRTHTKFGQPNQTLDYLILTHGDRDHYNQVEKFITTLQVKVARLAYSGYSSDYNKLIETILAKCPKCEVLLLGPDFPVPLKILETAIVDVLMANAPGPSDASDAWRKNTGSIVLRLQYFGVQVILAGDATSDTEFAVLRTLEKKFNGDTGKTLEYLNSHVLKVGHHGSRRTSNSAAWIYYVQPRFLFISADRHGSLDDRTYTGHRLPQTLTLSLVEKYTQKLYKKCAQHNVVSAFDTADYTAYNAKPDVQGEPVPVPSVPSAPLRSWWEQPTTEGIFTSLVALDRNQPDASPFDQGAQFQLSISERGVEITSTFAPKNLTGGPIPVTDL